MVVQWTKLTQLVWHNKQSYHEPLGIASHGPMSVWKQDIIKLENLKKGIKKGRKKVCLRVFLFVKIY